MLQRTTLRTRVRPLAPESGICIILVDGVRSECRFGHVKTLRVVYEIAVQACLEKYNLKGTKPSITLLKATSVATNAYEWHAISGDLS
jgi:hypothetical protein